LPYAWKSQICLNQTRGATKNMKHVAAIIVAAGSGTRLGAAKPKQFLTLPNGRTMLDQCVHIFREHPSVTTIMVVRPSGSNLDLPKDVHQVAGGDSRAASVANGMEALAPFEPDYVLVHDAARCGLDHSLIDDVIAHCQENHVVVPVMPMVDSLRMKQEDGWSDVDRAHIFSMQTPQAMPYQTYLKLLEPLPATATDDASIMLQAGYHMQAVQGRRKNFKVTTSEDWQAMEREFQGHGIRTGQGFDVHQLEAGDGLWLGGVYIPCGYHLVGHSDADVLLHALTDAICGAACLGDIGQHFPPSDPQWKGASSDKFLRHVVELAEKKGWCFSHADVTIIGERPKISKHREEIRTSIASILSADTDRVNVKATTTEQLGFTGRGEGLAAMAVATLVGDSTS